MTSPELASLVARCRGTKVVAPPPVSSVAIVTCDRPASLRRCLESHLMGARRRERRFQFLVLDDSIDPEVRSQNQRIAAALAAEHGAPIRYGSRPQREAFAAALAVRSGVPEDLLRFALLGLPGLGTTCGANRNALLLDTPGELVVAADDDTVWGVADIKDSGGLAFTRGPALGEFEFFPDLETTWRSIPLRTGVDFVALHERLLGRALADTVQRIVPTEGLHGDPLPPDLRDRIAMGRAHTAVTQMGVLGDAGSSSPLTFLLLDGISRQRLLSSEAGYRSACTSRALLRRVSRPIVSGHPYCMGYVLGLDNRGQLPPFFPVLRNSDGIFGASLRVASRDAYIGQLPEAVPNDPPEARRWDDDAIWSTASRWRMGQLLMCAIGTTAMSARPGGTDRGLAGLGRDLIELGSRSVEEFEAKLGEQRRLQSQVRARQLAACLDRYQGEPAYWAKDVRRALDLSLAAAHDERLPPVEDLPQALPEPERRLLTRHVVLSFGRLLCAWSELVAAARSLVAERIRITEPV